MSSSAAVLSRSTPGSVPPLAVETGSETGRRRSGVYTICQHELKTLFEQGGHGCSAACCFAFGSFEQGVIEAYSRSHASIS